MAAIDLMALVMGTITPEASVETQMADMAAALNGHGVFARFLPVTPEAPNHPLLLALINHMRQSGFPSFIVNCNAKDELVLEKRAERNITIHDGWNIPLVAFMVDHPAHHIEHLQRAPEKALVTVVDEGHLPFLEKLNLPSRGAIFCPHGGPPPLPEQRDTAERPIDLLFVGNIDVEPSLQAWLAATAPGDTIVQRVLAQAEEAVREGESDIHRAVIDAFAGIGRDLTIPALAHFIAALDRFVSGSRRLEILAAIRSRRVTILGKVAPAAAARLSHHELKGPALFARGLSLMARTKLLLNSRVTFAGGAHERLFYGLSRGAVAATDPSRFLRSELANRQGMVMLPREGAEIDSLIDGLLAHPTEIDEIRARGLPHYARHHTWHERAGRILAGLEATGLLPAG